MTRTITRATRLLLLALALALAAGWTLGAAEPAQNGTYSLPLAEEKVTLVFMNSDTDTAGASYADGKGLAINAAEEATNVHIQWELYPEADYADVANLRLASQADLPDIMRLKGDQGGVYLAKAYASGAIIGLNDLIERYGNNYKAIMEANPEYKNAIVMPDGQIVAFHKTQYDSYSYAVQLIRQDWLDNLGLAMPKTLDEFIDVAIAFKTRDPDGNGIDDTYGIQCANPSGSMFEYNQLGSYFGLHLCTGSGWAMRDGKVTYEWVTPEAKDFIKWFRKLYEADVLPPDYMSVTYPDHDARVASGQVGLIPRSWPGNILEWAQPTSSMKQNQPDAKWVLVPMMETEYSKMIVKEPTFRRSNGVAITSACKNPELAYQWLDWTTYDPVGSRLNNLGIEGLMYEMVDGKPVTLQSPYNARTPVEDGTWWGREFVELIYNDDIAEAGFKISGMSKDDAIIQSILANKQYLEEPFYPPIPSLEDSATITNLLADIDTYRSEMWVKFMDGTIDIDAEWDGYVSALTDGMQLSKVLQLYQAAYDALNG